MFPFAGPSKPMRISVDPAQLSFSTGFYSPGLPPTPTSAEPVRVFDFAAGQNLQITPRAYEPFGFPQLRAFANQELVRLAIETRKDQMERMEWQVKPREGSRRKHDSDDRVRKVERLLSKPDGRHDFATWMRLLIEDLLVLDAPAIERIRNRRGEVVKLDVVPGDSIKLLVDQTGRAPAAPLPAYQQVIKGRIWANLTTDDLIYAPRNIRTGHLYGLSPVEQIIVTINMALQRQTSQLAWFTEGTIPKGFATVPDNWTPDQIKSWQEWFNAMMAGNAGARQQVMWAPHGSQFQAIKDAPIKDEFDEWLARIVTFAFALPPTAFVRQMNVGTAQDDRQRSQEEGLAPLLLWAKRLLDNIIRDDLGFYDLEFSWRTERALDAKTQSEIDDRQIRSGVVSINEVRDRDGRDPVAGGEEPLVFLPSGPVPLSRVVAGYVAAQEHAEAVRDLELSEAQQMAAARGEALANAGDEPDDEQGADDGPNEPTSKLAKVAASGDCDGDWWDGEPHAPGCGCGAHAAASEPLTKAEDAVLVAERAARAHIDAAAAGAETDPSPARKEAGNYRKGHVVVHGLDITIETPKGATRSGTGADGKPWSVIQPAHYGYVKRTTGADGDHVDVYVGPAPLARWVYVVDQVDPVTTAFDEHKIMLGFKDSGAATLAYVKAFSDGKGPDRLGRMTRMTIPKLKAWLASGNTKTPLAKRARRGEAAHATVGKPAATIAATTTPAEPHAAEEAAPGGPFDDPAIRRVMTRVEKRLAKALAVGAENVSAEVARLLDDATAKVDATDDLAKDASAAGKAKSFAAKVTSALKFGWLVDAVEDIAGELAGVARQAATAVLDKAGVKSATERKAATNRAADWARQRAAEMVGKAYVNGVLVDNPNAAMTITESMRKAIAREIARGLDQQLSTEQIARRIGKLGTFSKDRARMIARTEVARARNAAVLEGAKLVRDTGRVVQVKSWVTAERPCQVCLDNEAGGPQTLDAMFASGHAAPPAHPNCMCAVEVIEAPKDEDEPKPVRGLASAVRKP